MKTLYFLAGGSKTLIFIDDAPFVILFWKILLTYSLNRVGNPGIMEVPPEISILP